MSEQAAGSPACTSLPQLCLRPRVTFLQGDRNSGLLRNLGETELLGWGQLYFILVASGWQFAGSSLGVGVQVEAGRLVCPR